MHVEQPLEFVPVSSEEHISTVVRLAAEIWPEHYRDIIGQDQVDYMLQRFQSATAVAAQLDEGYEYFLLRMGERWVGYASVLAESQMQRLFVSKLYLLKALRGRGLGRESVSYLSQLAHRRGLSKLWLTVNKYNPSLTAYLRMGFVNDGAVVTDIGGGYVMDDYRLEMSALPV